RPRVGSLPFQGVDESSFLAADVAAGGEVQVHIYRDLAAENTLAQKPCLLRFNQGAGQVGSRFFVAAPDVYEGMAPTESVAGKRHPLDQAVGIGLEQDTILVGARLHLVAVADEPARPGEVPRHEGPFLARREAGAAAPAQPGV